MPGYEPAYVDQNREPEGIYKTLFACLMAKELLGNQSPWPATSQGKEMKRIFRGSPAAGFCRGLVHSVEIGVTAANASLHWQANGLKLHLDALILSIKKSAAQRQLFAMTSLRCRATPGHGGGASRWRGGG